MSTDPLDGIAWGDDDYEPQCEHCGDTGWEPYALYDGSALTRPCTRCFRGED